MTDAERAALLRLIEYPAGPGLRVTTPEGAEAILRVVEGPIRADEREACARIAAAAGNYVDDKCDEIARIIRARGEL